MPKICLLGDSASPHTKRWCKYLNERGWDMSLVSFSGEKIEKVNCFNFPIDVKQDGGNWQCLKYVPKIREVVKKIDPDIINAHYLTSYGLVGILMEPRLFVASPWGSDILVTPHKNKLFYFLTKIILKRAKLVTSDSNFMTDEIINFGIAGEKIITQPMGVDLDIIKNSVYMKDNLFANDEIKILSLRTLTKNSNIDSIIKALKILTDNDRGKKYILNIANGGIEDRSLKCLVKTLNLESHVNFMGFLNRDRLISEMTKNEIYVSIPTSDSTSVSLLEAMGIGLYPIVSDIPTNREWINDGVNGSLMPVPLHPEQISNSILSTISRLDYVKKALNFNFDVINKKAIWENNMRIIAKKYEELIKQ